MLRLVIFGLMRVIRVAALLWGATGLRRTTYTVPTKISPMRNGLP